MKLLLLLTLGMGLAWTLQGQSQVPVQLGFNPKQVAGSWVTHQLASTEKSDIEEEGAYECFMNDIALLNDGDLKVTYFHRKDGKCLKEFYVAEKTDVPGRYTFDYEGKNYLTFVAVNDDYTIMDLENQREGNPLTVVELHGRTQDIDERAVKVYKSYISTRGIVPDNIVDVSLKRCKDS